MLGVERGRCRGPHWGRRSKRRVGVGASTSIAAWREVDRQREDIRCLCTELRLLCHRDEWLHVRSVRKHSTVPCSLTVQPASSFHPKICVHETAAAQSGKALLSIFATVSDLNALLVTRSQLITLTVTTMAVGKQTFRGHAPFLPPQPVEWSPFPRLIRRQQTLYSPAWNDPLVQI